MLSPTSWSFKWPLFKKSSSLRTFFSPASELFVHAFKAVLSGNTEGTSKSLADHGLRTHNPLMNSCGLTSASGLTSRWYVAGDNVTMVPVVSTKGFCLTEVYETCSRTQSSVLRVVLAGMVLAMSARMDSSLSRSVCCHDKAYGNPNIPQLLEPLRATC
jgi:hypothetical protein